MQSLKQSRTGNRHWGGPTLLPLCFAALYGSGFVGAKFGLPDSNPLSFLTLRFLIAGVLLLIIARRIKTPIPSLQDIMHISVAGTFTVATFSIGVFVSIDLGLSPALSALIIALQPLLVATFARRLIGESLNLVQWLGLGLGLVGVVMVVEHNIDLTSAGLLSVAMSVIGLLRLTLGSLYQKKYCAEMDLFSGGCIQSLVSGLICLSMLTVFGQFSVQWSQEFVGALIYMTVGVSLGALSLLYLMIRRGEVSKVASVFYLVPLSAALTAYLLFGESFDAATLTGAAIIAIGVYLTINQGAANRISGLIRRSR